MTPIRALLVPQPESASDATSVAARKFAHRIGEHLVGDQVRISVSWIEGRTPKAGEMVVETTADRYHLLYRNRQQPWDGLFATACIDHGAGDRAAEGVLFVRDTNFTPGQALAFCSEVCREVGGVMRSFESRTHDGFVLYEVSFVPVPSSEAGFVRCAS